MWNFRNRIRYIRMRILMEFYRINVLYLRKMFRDLILQLESCYIDFLESLVWHLLLWFLSKLNKFNWKYNINWQETMITLVKLVLASAISLFLFLSFSKLKCIYNESLSCSLSESYQKFFDKISELVQRSERNTFYIHYDIISISHKQFYTSDT